MGYEWFNEIDGVTWYFEEVVERLAGQKMLGAAPSAGDEARAILKARASAGRSPLQLLAEVEKLTEDDVRTATENLAAGAVECAIKRRSRHVTREDVRGASKAAGYPFGG